MSNKNVRVKVRALVLLEEIMDKSNAEIRPGKLKGSQKKLVIELPVVELPETDWNTRLAAAQNVLQHGNTVSASLPPLAITEDVTGITDTEAVIHAHAHPRGAATGMLFQYGTTPDLGTAIAPDEGAVFSDDELIPLSYAMSGLTPSTKYYYRIQGISGDGTGNGLTQSFTTDPTPSV